MWREFGGKNGLPNPLPHSEPQLEANDPQCVQKFNDYQYISEFLQGNLFAKDSMKSLNVDNLNNVYKYFTCLEYVISFVQ